MFLLITSLKSLLSIHGNHNMLRTMILLRMHLIIACGSIRRVRDIKRSADEKWQKLLKCRRIQGDVVEIVRCVYTVDGMSKGFTFVYVDIL